MEAEIQQLLDAFADLRERANVNTCFGEPVTVEERTVIPVASVGYGFGLGMCQGSEIGETEETEETEEADDAAEMAGSGGGGGMGARPLAAIEVTPEGTRVEPIIDEQKVALAGILLGGWTVFWLGRALIGIFGRRE